MTVVHQALSMDSPAAAPEGRAVPAVDRIVDELSLLAGIPPPRVAVTADGAFVASVAGHGTAVVTLGAPALGGLGARELRGMLAHEIAHIRNRDAWVVAMAMRLVPWLGRIALAGLTAAVLGGRRGRVGSMLAGLLLALAAGGMAAPICAVSRAREFRADEMAASLTGDPEGLALAIEQLRIEPDGERRPWPPSAVSGFAGSRLFAALATTLDTLSTHPSTADRVARLRAMTGRRS
jgi:heat shock protein HtpX